nr:ribonuclease H-like domain-containing protein [Tanacetum cinerariifolium]
MLKAFPLPEFIPTAMKKSSSAEVIEFGDSYEAPQQESTTASASEGTAKKKGRTVAFTTEDMQKRRNDTFGRNEATKKTKKNMLKQQYGNFKAEAKNNSGNEEVNTASIPTASTQVSPASPNIDKDDIEEMDIKWNMALLSMRVDKFWKKTGKNISIQGTDVAGFDKSKVECFNCHKMGYFARKCRAPRSQERGRRENYRQGSKEEEHAPKALMAIDRVGWD